MDYSHFYVTRDITCLYRVVEVVVECSVVFILIDAKTVFYIEFLSMFHTYDCKYFFKLIVFVVCACFHKIVSLL